MENPEEVLQALDEFQKMRPTEIPRELEEYLSWVAKTGDPVYQWSLIKSLFREKLTRVMTDFYESCPTLELAPCPNVEHFNYDTMKSNLLERLESFANAPFTVQRICELLTAPRKEYNRIDKFMRAIEKNILVVSTREPGPVARRNENGESLVNGTVEDDNPLSQPAPDIEMEAWVKDYTLSGGINVHAGDLDAGNSAKAVPPTNGTSPPPEKSPAKSNPKNSNFVPSTSEFANVNVNTQSQDTDISASIQNLSQISMETSSTIVGDVPEAIMNEDTSSQPSLDLENEDGESSGDSAKKLQTTFQAKDFEAKAQEPVEANVRCHSKEKAAEEEEVEEEERSEGRNAGGGDVDAAASKEAESESGPECKSSEYSKETDSRVETPETTAERSEGKEGKEESPESTKEVRCFAEAGTPDGNNENADNAGPSGDTTDDAKATSMDSYKSDESSTESNNDFAFNDESLQKTQGIAESSSSDDSNGQTRAEKEPEPESEPVVAEPPTETSVSPNAEESTESSETKPTEDGLTIEETTEDITRLKPMVPSPIPIIEEPKDTDCAKEERSAEEVSEIVREEDPTSSRKESEGRPEEIVEEAQTEKERSDDKVTEEEEEEDRSKNAMESMETGEEAKPAESMEVDGQEARVTFSQDEPMEQEMTDLTKS